MRKFLRIENLPLLLTLVFCLVCAGIYLGQTASGDPIRVVTSGGGEPAALESDDPAPGMLEGEKLDLNSASQGDLTRLPGIGEQRAADIVAYREAEGGFSSVEELLKISGIGESTLEGLRDYVTIGTARD